MFSLDKLEIVNIQKHEHLVLEFTKGVNIIAGPTDAGKSVIRRSIEFLCDFNICDGLRKQGTKQSSVKGWFSNGIVLTRIRSNSINRYILEKDGEEKVFDAIGKSAPEEITNALGMFPFDISNKKIYLNSAPQMTLPFLFDLSPIDRAKIFNKLTGNDILDKIFTQFNKDILGINREHKREIECLEKQVIDLEEIEVKKEKMETVFECVTKSVQFWRQNGEKYSKLLELSELVTHNHVTIVETKRNISLIKIPDLSEIKGLRTKIDRLEQLKIVSYVSEQTEMSIYRVRGQLKEIRPVTVNLDTLYSKIERLNTLKKIQSDLDKNTDICYTLNEKLEIVKSCTINCTDQYKELLKSVQICPTCGGKITEECLKGIKL